MIRKNKGQAALVMILVLAISFIFYSIELNWGKIADLKISTWMAAHSAASQMASSFASYSERLLQEYLLNDEAQDNFDYFPENETTSGGTSFESGDLVNYTACQGSWLFLKILVIIIIIIIIILTWGASAPLLAWVGVALMVVSLVLEYAVIMPMQRAMWNKLMQNLQPVDQMREGGIQTGIMLLANDTVNLPDRFDMNGNGRWGFNGINMGGEAYLPNDTVSRFAFFVTERLKHIKPQEVSPYPAYQDFIDTLGNFIGTTSLGGTNNANALTISGALGASSSDPNSLGTSLFCGGSRTRYITATDVAQANIPGINSADLFSALVAKEWVSPVRTNPISNVDEVQILVDFSNPLIINQMYEMFGENKDAVLSLMKNAQMSNFNPICNPACTHGTGPEHHGYSLGWTYGNATASAQRLYVPDECQACSKAVQNTPIENTPCPPFNEDHSGNLQKAQDYRLLYNPYIENPIPTNALNKADKGFSFGARFGHDDELNKGREHKIDNTSGIVFPMLEQMDQLSDAPPTKQLANESDRSLNVYSGEGRPSGTSNSSAATQLSQAITTVFRIVGTGQAGELYRDIVQYGGINKDTLFTERDHLETDIRGIENALDQTHADLAQIRAQVRPLAQDMKSRATTMKNLASADKAEYQRQIDAINRCRANLDDDDDDNCGSTAGPTALRDKANELVQDLQTVIDNVQIILNKIDQIQGSTGSNRAGSTSSYDNPQVNAEVAKVPNRSDSVGKILNYKAPDNMCAFQSNSAGGLYWKKGSDRYCSADVTQYWKRDPASTQSNPVYKTEYDILRTNYPGIFAQTQAGANPPKHWPYEDCTYMHEVGTGNPISCGSSGSNATNWPQDRLDAVVYGLPALIGLNEYLHDINSAQLNIGVNQWYAQVATFIAPKCTAQACSQRQERHPNQPCNDLCQGQGCAAMDSNPVIQALSTKFGNNYATCNPQYHGYILQWWYDMQNWMRLTYNWLYTAHSGDVCNGPAVAGNPGLKGQIPGFNQLNHDAPHPALPARPPQVVPQAGNVVDCLYQKSYFLQDLDECWYGTLDKGVLDNSEPISSPFPMPYESDRLGTVYPYMTYACKKVIWEAQRYGATNFVTALPSGLPEVGDGYSVSISGTGRPSGPGIITDYPPNNGDENYGTSAEMKDIYEKIRAWVQVNVATVHAVKSRYSDLSDMTYKAIDAMNLFNEGANKMYNFINAGPINRGTQSTDPVGGGYGARDNPNAGRPYYQYDPRVVYELMGTRAANGFSSTLDLPRLPGFVIYGWQDAYKDSKATSDDPANGVESPIGKWHLARMEVRQPDKLPTIEANEQWGFHGISGPQYNCYTAKDIRGDVWARATRWDSPDGEIANYGNKGARIWGFTYSNMTTGRANLTTINKALDPCPGLRGRGSMIQASPSKMLQLYCPGKNIGRTENSVEGYQVSACTPSNQSCVPATPSYSNIATSNLPRSVIEEAFNLNQAFMFNFNPLSEGSSDYMEVSDSVRDCYCVANAILASLGTMSHSGAHYAIPVAFTGRPKPQWHQQIKFNDIDDVKSDDDLFPTNGITMDDLGGD